MLRYAIGVLLLMFNSTKSIGQEIDCQLRASLSDHTIDTIYGNPYGESIVFVKKLKFYIHTAHNGQTSPERALLLSLKNPRQTISIDGPFQVYLGVDSTLNYDGIHEGALDPINNMYWTWQTGYIHCKLEGYILNQSAKRSFEFHIGGYSTKDSGPFWIGQNSDSKSLEVQFDLYPAIEWALKNEVFRITSPGKISDEMAQFFRKGITVL